MLKLLCLIYSVILTTDIYANSFEELLYFNYDKEIENNHNLMYIFIDKNCQHCKNLSVTLAQLKQEFVKENLLHLKINIIDCSSNNLCEKNNINYIPYIKYFVKGKAVDYKYKNKSLLKSFIRKRSKLNTTDINTTDNIKNTKNNLIIINKNILNYADYEMFKIVSSIVPNFKMYNIINEEISNKYNNSKIIIYKKGKKYSYNDISDKHSYFNFLVELFYKYYYTLNKTTMRLIMGDLNQVMLFISNNKKTAEEKIFKEFALEHAFKTKLVFIISNENNLENTYLRQNLGIKITDEPSVFLIKFKKEEQIFIKYKSDYINKKYLDQFYAKYKNNKLELYQKPGGDPEDYNDSKYISFFENKELLDIISSDKPILIYLYKDFNECNLSKQLYNEFITTINNILDADTNNIILSKIKITKADIFDYELDKYSSFRFPLLFYKHNRKVYLINPAKRHINKVLEMYYKNEFDFKYFDEINLYYK